MAFWCKGKKGYCDNIGSCDDNCEHVDNTGGIEVEDDDVEDVFIAQWISVNKRLPDTQHIMLVCTRNRNGIPKVAMASYHDGFGWCGSGGRWGNVTHWMPLPNVPEVNDR